MPLTLSALVVDNSRFMREKLKLLLEQNGCEIVGEAADAAEAVERYQHARPDLVTLDIVMPIRQGLDGVGALRATRALDPDASVVMISALGQSRRIEECLREGAVDFLLKPLREDALERVLGELRARLEQGDAS